MPRDQLPLRVCRIRPNPQHAHVANISPLPASVSNRKTGFGSRGRPSAPSPSASKIAPPSRKREGTLLTTNRPAETDAVYLRACAFAHRRAGRIPPACVHACGPACAGTYAHVHVRVWLCLCVRACVRACVRVRVGACVLACLHACMRACQCASARFSRSACERERVQRVQCVHTIIVPRTLRVAPSASRDPRALASSRATASAAPRPTAPVHRARILWGLLLG